MSAERWIGLNHLGYWPGPEKVVGWELHRRWWGHGLTYRGTHVISGAEIVWYAIDNTG